MRPIEKHIEKRLKKLIDITRPELDRKILDDCRTEFDKQQSSMPTPRPTQWRMTMDNKIMKAVAALITVAAVLIGINIFSGTPVWAIEQTIEALQDIRGVYLSGTVNTPEQSEEMFEIWAKPNSQNPLVSGDFRLQEGSHHIAVASESRNLTFVYSKTPVQDIVYITEGLNRTCNPFPASDLFKQFKELATNWQQEYKKDPQTGRDCVYVKFEGPALNTARYWQLQCDLKTKLPVRLSVWWNPDYTGRPHYDFRTITYNPEMSDSLFLFEIPDDAQVVDCRKIRQMLDQHSNWGIPVNGFSTDEACQKTAQAYWLAVIEQDISSINRLRPSENNTDSKKWFDIYKQLNSDNPVNIVSMNHLNDPGTFAEVTCLLKTQPGHTARSILNIELRQTDQGLMGVVVGTVGPELVMIE